MMSRCVKMNSSISNPNEGGIKTRFAINFVSAMKRLNRSRGLSTRKRYWALRAAARTSMACAVGPERAWSRAVLRNRRRRKGSRRRNPREKVLQVEGEEEEDVLRGLVPGGQQMEFCSLLTETAHYIKCLQAQLQATAQETGFTQCAPNVADVGSHDIK